MQHPRSVMVVTKQDRNDWASELGQYFICAQAYAAVSAESDVQEGGYKGQYAAKADHLYTFLLHKKEARQFRIKQNEFDDMYATLKIEASVWTTKEENDLSRL